MKGSFLGSPLKLPQAIQLMEKPRSVQGSLAVELHCGGGDIGRERNEEGLVGAAQHTGRCAFRAIGGLTTQSSRAIPFWKL